MTTFVLTSGNDTRSGGSSDDVFDGYNNDDGVGATGGLDNLAGRGGADLFLLNSEYSLVAGSIDGGAGTDTVRAYGFDMGTLSFSNVEILSVESYSFGAQISQLNEFETITTSLSPTQKINIYALGGGGTIDFSTRITGGLSVELSGVATTSGFNVTGTSNNDVFNNTAYNDTVRGGDGTDAFFARYSDGASGGVDAMFGGAGNDTFHVRKQSGSIDGGSGTDTVVAYQFSSQGIFTTGDLSTLTFTNVERLISGPAITYGSLSQLNSFRTITGGDSAGLIRFDLSGGPGGSIDFSTKLKQADEHIFFRAYNATGAVQVTGTAGDDLIGGSDFADTLVGGNGDDTLDGDGGADALIGGAGNDIYQTDGSDTLTETLTGSAGGTDTVRSSVSFDLKQSALLQGEFENLTLNGFGASNGFGNDFDNVLIGSGYDNVLNGRAGADTMRGGAGNDTFYVDNVGDVVQELDWRNDGTETVRSTINFDLNDTAKVIGYVENVYLLGTANLNATGNTLNNILTGNSGDNVLSGNAGSDKLLGRDGDDTLIGGDGDDRLLGGSGADNLDGGAGFDRADYSDASAGLTADLWAPSNNTGSAAGDTYASVEGLAGSRFNDSLRGDKGANTIWGLEGNDKIFGYAGNDKLEGGSGNDRIAGGAGRDIMTGGGDNDTFVFKSVLDSVVGGQRDRIQDFAQGADLVGLSAIDAVSGGGDNAFTFIGGTTFSGAAGELRFFQLSSGSGQTIVEGDVDGNGAADFQIGLLGLHTLNAGDFIL